jgi:hypothetical protein
MLEPAHSCRPTVSRHAAQDRLAYAQAVLRDIGNVKTWAMVAHEGFHEL